MAREYRVNERIRIPEVRLVAEDGTQLGVMATREALVLAREQDLDLVEVAPNSVPPVCRLLDYGKFRYLQSTKEREMRKGQKAHGMREVRFRPKIGQHDIDFKSRLVSRLLGEGNKVKVSVMFRGREIAHPELAVNLLRRVHDTLKDESKLEQAPNLEGRFMSIILTPAKAGAKPAPVAVEQVAPAAKQPAAAAPAPPAAPAEPVKAVAAQAEPAAAEEPVKAVAAQAEPAAAEEPVKAVAAPAPPAAAEEPVKAEAAPAPPAAPAEPVKAEAAQAEPAAAEEPVEAEAAPAQPAAAEEPVEAVATEIAAPKPAKAAAKKPAKAAVKKAAPAAAKKPAKATAKKA